MEFFAIAKVVALSLIRVTALFSFSFKMSFKLPCVAETDLNREMLRIKSITAQSKII